MIVVYQVKHDLKIDNQDELVTWHKIFQRSPSPRLEFWKAKSSLDGCDSVLHDDWLDIP